MFYTNRLCEPDFTIDSAFVDKYCDLGSDVITLFADNTVYQLTINTTDPINPVFVYNRSQPLKEWSKRYIGDFVKFGHSYYHLIPKLKNITYNKLTIDEIRRYLSQTTAGFAFNDYFYLFAGNRVCRLNYKTFRFDDNCLTQTIDQWIRRYLSQTTAGFAFNDYFYLFAGNRVCRMHNTTLRFDDNCLNQTIAQWIGCGNEEIV
ncbi:unnamed protein product [Medioppia subpectinata]|uniref:Uncharacterized protein n=1 Tax=Medioppia subpectinata TaxID=1979941 RepID=A0A7R9KEX1_9ACAR|nr:unnamed protein product [Medioppia subpectinata]CAG2102109.1 unnamed protein product [Medioppia subpectinata]